MLQALDLDAILAFPHSEEPRLHIAERLLRQKNPRGELIALQCGPGHFPELPIEPSLVGRRITELLEQFEDGRLDELGLKKGEAIWNRGFVEGVTLTLSRFWEVHERLWETSPCTTLTLSGGEPPNLERFSNLVEVARLRSLSFRLGQLGDRDVRTLASSPYLTGLSNLDLGYNQITSLGVTALVKSAALVNLRRLCLDVNPLDDAGVGELGRNLGFSGLRSLSLVLCHAAIPGARSLANCAALGQLEELNLQNNSSIGSAGVGLLLDSPHLKNLRRLVIDDYLSDEMLEQYELRFGPQLEWRAERAWIDENEGGWAT